MLNIKEEDFLDIVSDAIVESKTYLLIHDNKNFQEVTDYRKIFKIDIKKENILHYENVREYIKNKKISFKNLNLLSETKLKILKKMNEKNVHFHNFSSNYWNDIMAFQYSFTRWLQDNETENVSNYLYLLENSPRAISKYFFKEIVNFLLNHNQEKSLIQFLKNHPNHLKPPIIAHIQQKCGEPLLNDFLNNQKKSNNIFYLERIKSSKITIDMQNFIAKYYLEESLDSQKYAKPINFFLKNYLKKDKNIKNSYSIIKINHIIIVNEINDDYDEDKFLNYFEEFLDFYFKKQKALYSDDLNKTNKSSIFFKNHETIIKSIDANKFFTYLVLKDGLKSKKSKSIVNKI